MSLNPNPVIEYFTDPLCPWCYAFVPIFHQFMEKYQDKFEFKYIAGGLRINPDARPMNADDKDMLYGYWETVEMETGQKFDMSAVDALEFAFNTEPACRAIVAVKNLYPQRVFDFELNLLKAFYSQRRNPTAIDTFSQVIAEMNLSQDEFEKAYDSQEIIDKANQDFALTKSQENPLLPMVFIVHQGISQLLTKGYCSLEMLEEMLAETQTNKNLQ
jgi:putative protein-disulfide isomerase